MDPNEKAEAARVRRRWLTLGELLAIAAVAISGLTLWNSYRERTDASAERQADDSKSQRVASILVLKATPSGNGRTLGLAPTSSAQTIQGQTISFPSALNLSPVETTGDARIERDWLDRALVRARKDAGAKGETFGDARLPVMIVTRYLVDGDPRTDRAIYQLGYATDEAFLNGTTVRLRGLSRIGAAKDDAAGRKAIDASWKAQLSAR